MQGHLMPRPRNVIDRKKDGQPIVVRLIICGFQQAVPQGTMQLLAACLCRSADAVHLVEVVVHFIQSDEKILDVHKNYSFLIHAVIIYTYMLCL